MDGLLAAGEVRIAEENIVRRKCTCSRDSLSGPIANRRLRATSGDWRLSPGSVSPRAISHAFGTPKPTLANSYRPELLNLRTFPTLMGYSSRIMAESWESNLLYYAALADEIHARPRS